MISISRLQMHLSVWKKALATWIPPTAVQRSIRDRCACMYMRAVHANVRSTTADTRASNGLLSFCYLVHIQDWKSAADMQVLRARVCC